SLLQQMRGRLEQVLRESDYVIRWGGEEFLIVSRSTNRADAKAVAERIRAAICGDDFELPDGSRLAKTCSVGFACYPFLPTHPSLLSWSQVVELSDRALYLAKHSGRNAWVGLYATDTTQADGLVERLAQKTERESLLAGDLRIVSNAELPIERPLDDSDPAIELEEKVQP
ncbi:MAG TPA: GGDEF domain-containing protein, partial [Albitalea sp.]|nr:GGDEF domain-containing protein [Albitalea sp.]